MRSIIETTNVPIVLRQFVSEWPIFKWSMEQWCSAFGDRQMPFRTLKRSTVSEEPCWERKCLVKTMTFNEFIKQLNNSSEEWMYFDYKYMHQWFAADDNIIKVGRYWLVFFLHYVQKFLFYSYFADLIW